MWAPLRKSDVDRPLIMPQGHELRAGFASSWTALKRPLAKGCNWPKAIVKRLHCAAKETYRRVHCICSNWPSRARFALWQACTRLRALHTQCTRPTGKPRNAGQSCRSIIGAAQNRYAKSSIRLVLLSSQSAQYLIGTNHEFTSRLILHRVLGRE